MKTLTQAGDVTGKRVLVRCSLNVPVANNLVRDDFRLTKVLPTIEYLREHGAKVLILGHIGRDDKDTLLPVYEYLEEKFPLTFLQHIDGNETEIFLKTMKNGDVVLFENVRGGGDREEDNDAAFAKLLASYADLYVNEAFGASHRHHASIVSVPKHIPGYMGLQFEKELEELTHALNPEHPFLFILGGAKFETKLPLIEKFLTIADKVFVGGALANDLFKAKGYEVGKSLVSDSSIDCDVLCNAENIILPIDVKVIRAGKVLTITPDKVEEEDTIVDAGPDTVDLLGEEAKKAAFILWNGPLGNYEAGFQIGTTDLATHIAKSNAESIVGGGDTLATLQELDIHDQFSFVSTGGGAMLQFLADETLPGIEALQ